MGIGFGFRPYPAGTHAVKTGPVPGEGGTFGGSRDFCCMKLGNFLVLAPEQRAFGVHEQPLLEPRFLEHSLLLP
jgi:hypothetical protein